MYQPVVLPLAIFVAEASWIVKKKVTCCDGAVGNVLRVAVASGRAKLYGAGSWLG
jgi:hypothetical protein